MSIFLAKSVKFVQLYFMTKAENETAKIVHKIIVMRERKGLPVGAMMQMQDGGSRVSRMEKEGGREERGGGGEGACVSADVDEVGSLANGGHVCKMSIIELCMMDLCLN